MAIPTWLEGRFESADVAAALSFVLGSAQRGGMRPCPRPTRYCANFVA
jgi:hypothetical protein